MKRRKVLSSSLCLIITLVCVGNLNSVSAQLLVASSISDPTFSSATVSQISGDASGAITIKQAVSFTPTSSAFLDFIELALTYRRGSNHLDVGIFSDDAGTVGTLLESSSVNVTETDPQNLTKVEFEDSLFLDLAQQYWIGLATGDGSDGILRWWSDGNTPTTTFVSANDDLQSPFGRPITNATAQGYKVFGQRDLDSIAVPEPSTFGMISVLAIGILIGYRKFKTKKLA